jgi:hypothetical protein
MSVVIGAVREMASHLMSLDIYRMVRETAQELSVDLEAVFAAEDIPDALKSARLAAKQVTLMALLCELEERGVLRDIEDYLKELYVLPRAPGALQ